MYFAYLNKIVSELDMRFSGKQAISFQFQFFLPCHVKSLTYESISEALSLYERFFNDTSKTAVEPELQRWKKRAEQFSSDKSILNILAKFANDKTFQSFYPTVFIALKLLATLPVTTAAVER